MPTLKFSFLKNSLLFLLFIIFASSCNTYSRVWDIPVDAFRRELKNGNHAIITSTDLDSVDAREIRFLIPGGAYYAGMVCLTGGRKVRALRLFTISAEYETGYYKKQSLKHIIRMRSEAQLWSLVDTAIAAYEDLFPPDADVMFKKAESLYWQNKNERALGFIDSIPPEVLSFWQQSEIAMMRAVILHRISHTDWKTAFVDFFIQHPASSLHQRIFSYIQTEQLENDFGEDEKAIMRAKYLLASQKSEAAGVLFADLMKKKAAAISNFYFFYDYYNAFRANRSRAGANILAGGQPEFTSPQQAYAYYFYTALLFREASAFSSACIFFSKAHENAYTTGHARRALWYEADCLSKISVSKTFLLLHEELATIQNKTYFDDIFDSLLSGLLLRGEFDLIQQHAPVVFDLGSPAAKRQYAYALLRLNDSGLLQGVHTDKLQGFLQSGPLNDYYRQMYTLSAGNLKIPVTEKPEGVLPDEADIIQGYLDFALDDNALDFILSIEDEFTAAEKKAVIGMFPAGKYPAGAMRVSEYLLAGRKATSRWALEALYPRPYMAQVVRESGGTSFPPAFAWAVIREESRFDTRAVSRTGAVGLTQLMPETAAEVIRRRRMEKGELTDPQLNISLGLWYLEHLAGRLEGNLPLAAAAYNAGITRVRRWKAGTQLPLDLMIETFAFAETRGYVKKVLSSYLMYEVLYSKTYMRQAQGLVFAAENQNGAQE